MFTFRTSKIFYLVPAVILALSDAASANNCTEAIIQRAMAPFYNAGRGYRIDSSYSKVRSYESAYKYVYEDDKPVEMHINTKTDDEETDVVYFYYDIDDSTLKKDDDEESFIEEYIISKCEAGDTLCYEEKYYSNGHLWGKKSIKIMPNYAITLTLMGSGVWYEEYFMYSDSIIINRYIDYYPESDREWQIIYGADPDDKNKCYQYDADGKIDSTFSYKPNEKGFSISVEGETYFKEFFFLKNEEPLFIQKHRVPVKISPKARYFDLLGRYKFTK